MSPSGRGRNMKSYMSHLNKWWTLICDYQVLIQYITHTHSQNQQKQHQALKLEESLDLETRLHRAQVDVSNLVFIQDWCFISSTSCGSKTICSVVHSSEVDIWVRWMFLYKVWIISFKISGRYSHVFFLQMKYVRNMIPCAKKVWERLAQLPSWWLARFSSSLFSSASPCSAAEGESNGYQAIPIYGQVGYPWMKRALKCRSEALTLGHSIIFLDAQASLAPTQYPCQM